ncbi:hypothetical protein [Hymenobacter weizhouensis]|uniref:hypothetical protein n=1 Tax=Hymenobacter sp. YIM 151500-1 TaxID=2987689 RepID=UPI00222713B8|nr:hypothetical protein [Hymenobacter sp. YIM 151500-1]UYZ62020.1 hypothetical protein OIS53_13520 [Hymenobacter sp. YIM 151500-1]
MPATFPFYLLLALAVVLGGGLAVAAWRRPNRRWRAARLAAGLAAVGGLWLLAFPPARTAPAPVATDAILLTPGYQPDTLRHLLARLGAGTPLWRYGAEPGTAAPDTPTLSNLPVLRHLLPQLRRLHVLGQGLPAADVPLLPAAQLVVHQPRPRVGFRSAAWARQPELGQSWAVEGFFEQPPARNEPVWISLHAAGAARDSVRLPAGQGAFRVRYTPKTVGRAVYTLVARQAGQRVAAEPVPLDVQAARPLRVLLLAVAPSFEVRFLKNHLAAHQHQVAVRTGLSRGLTQTEFLNLPSRPALGRLTPALLRSFDVVLTDPGTLAGLSAAEAAGVHQAVRRGSLGLLLLTEATAPLPAQLPGRAAFRVQGRSGAAATVAHRLTWPDAPARLTALAPATLAPGPALRPVILDADQHPVAATQRVGLGQVLLTTATETYTWLLQGAPTAYDTYWSRLLTAVAPPPATTGLQLTPLNNWPRPHAPLLLQTTNAPRTPLALSPPVGASVRLALRQDEAVPEWATATFWPAVSGWHEVRLGTSSQWFYVFGEADWRGPEQQARSAAARGWQSVAPPSTPTAAVVPPARTYWPRWVGFLVFLAAAGLLWLEEKL